MYSLKELKSFALILENKKEPNLIRLRVLKTLNNWDPIKSQIIDSQIGKCLYRLTKESGEMGYKSMSIVNKWKEIFIDNSESHDNKNKKFKIINKREHKEKVTDIPPKKKCLSLKDYYKRNPNLGPEDIQENTKESSKNELNSTSGISFLDSITVKPPSKIKNNNIINKSQLILGISNRMAQPFEINLIQTMVKNDMDIEDPYMKIPCKPKLYHTTKRHVQSVPEITEKCFDISIKNPPSLLNQCQDVLLVHKECIEEVLWTPRELLLHVLQAYNAEQLRIFESFNPRFIEENDDLWRIHCINKHKSADSFNACGSWRERYIKLNSYLEMKMQKSMTKLKSQIDNIKKEVQLRKVKVLPAPRKNPNVGRFFYRQGEDSLCSPATRKLRKQYKAVFNYLR